MAIAIVKGYVIPKARLSELFSRHVPFGFPCHGRSCCALLSRASLPEPSGCRLSWPCSLKEAPVREYFCIERLLYSFPCPVSSAVSLLLGFPAVLPRFSVSLPYFPCLITLPSAFLPTFLRLVVSALASCTGSPFHGALSGPFPHELLHRSTMARPRLHQVRRTGCFRTGTRHESSRTRPCTYAPAQGLLAQKFLAKGLLFVSPS